MGQIYKRDSSFNDYTKVNKTSKSRKVKPKYVNLQETNKVCAVHYSKEKTEHLLLVYKVCASLLC